MKKLHLSNSLQRHSHSSWVVSLITYWMYCRRPRSYFNMSPISPNSLYHQHDIMIREKRRLIILFLNMTLGTVTIDANQATIDRHRQLSMYHNHQHRHSANRGLFSKSCKTENTNNDNDHSQNHTGQSFPRLPRDSLHFGIGWIHPVAAHTSPSFHFFTNSTRYLLTRISNHKPPIPSTLLSSIHYNTSISLNNKRLISTTSSAKSNNSGSNRGNWFSFFSLKINITEIL
jgi:hypothetical protein